MSRRAPIQMLRAISAGLAALALVLSAGSAARADTPDRFTATNTGTVMVADCGTFQVWDDYVVNVRGIDRYDRDGDIVQSVIHYWGVDHLYSPETGKSFSSGFAQGSTIDWVKGIPWTEFQAVQAVHGIIFRINVPGAGVLFHDVGRIDYHLTTGEILFQAGPHQFFEGDFTGLCAALS